MRDIKNIRARLYAQSALLIDSLEGNEEMPLKDRLAALNAVRGIMTGLSLLRVADDDDIAAGSAVRRYSKAFNTPRKSSAPRSIAAVPDDDDHGNDAA
jgi:hypothetical protein